MLKISFEIKKRPIKVKKLIDKFVKCLIPISFPGKIFRNKSENSSKIFRRSIFITQNIEKGEKFTSSNIKIVRPGNGVDPSYYNQLINKKAPKKLFNGEPILPNILNRLRIK